MISFILLHLFVHKSYVVCPQIWRTTYMTLLLPFLFVFHTWKPPSSCFDTKLPIFIQIFWKTPDFARSLDRCSSSCCIPSPLSRTEIGGGAWWSCCIKEGRGRVAELARGEKTQGQLLVESEFHFRRFFCLQYHGEN